MRINFGRTHAPAHAGLAPWVEFFDKQMFSESLFPEQVHKRVMVLFFICENFLEQ